MQPKIKNILFSSWKKAAKKLNIDAALLDSPEKIFIEHPTSPDFGDYSSNIALKMASKTKVKSSVMAQTIVDSINKDKNTKNIIEKATNVSGFINIWLSPSALLNEAKKICNEDSLKKSLSKINNNKKILLEHTSPNTNKSLHIGHLRNNVFGMAIARLLKTIGNKVTIDCLYNDRGIHICKAMWAYVKYGHESQDIKDVLEYWNNHQDEWPTPQTQNKKPDHFVEQFYNIGVKSEENESNKKEMQELLVLWEANDKTVRALWRKLNNWVYEGFAITFKNIASAHDYYWYESDYYNQAKEMIQKGLETNVFKKLPNGAVLTNLESYKLPDTIVQRSDGTSMYFTQDIYLTSQKIRKFPSDKYIWIIGAEQQLHMQQIFAVCEQLEIDKREKFLHLWYGYVFLKGKGKMSSRKGTVVSIDSLVEESKKHALSLIEKNVEKSGITDESQKQEIAQKIGMAAIKYALLKQNRTQDINFDWDEAINVKGDCGPYLQYVYTRCVAIQNKSMAKPAATLPEKIEVEENQLLRTLYMLPEFIKAAALNLSPDFLTSYLFDLAKKFNTFYEKCPIVGSQQEQFRLLLTKATASSIKFGLELLGIEVTDKM